MAFITPKDLSGINFSRSFRGYNKEEVDEYIGKVVSNYASLYRRCAELEEQLAVANVRLDTIELEHRRARKNVESAKTEADRIIDAAYEKADDILVSIKKNCDAVLLDFRNKVDAQKDILAEIYARNELFKDELFDKYKTHIEYIKNLSSDFVTEEELGANEYVSRVITALKHEIKAEYDISVGSDDGIYENEMLDELTEDTEISSAEEIEAFVKGFDVTGDAHAENEQSQSETRAPAEEDEKTAVVIPEKIKKGARKNRGTKDRGVLEMLADFEKRDAKDVPRAVSQLMLDIESTSEVLIEAKK